MKLENEFTVPASVDEAWAVLLDVPRVAPCLPGAAIDEGESEDGTYNGTMTIKIGPITARYKGTVSIQESVQPNRFPALRSVANPPGSRASTAAPSPVSCLTAASSTSSRNGSVPIA